MVTREELKAYRDMERELREKRALMRQAELAAKESDRESDRRRAFTLAKQYERIAKERERELLRIEREIEALEDPRQRSVLLCRYIHGYGRVRTAMTLGVSERTVSYIAKEAIRKLSRK